MTTSAWVPIDRYLPRWPDNLLPAPDLSRFALVDHRTRLVDGVSTSIFRVAVLADVTLALPGVDVVTVALLPGTYGSEVTVEVDWTGPFAARVLDLGAELRVASPLLVPVEGGPGAWQPLLTDDGEPQPFAVAFRAGQVVLDGAGGLRFELDGALSLPAVMLGETGVVIEVTGARLSFSGEELPPATAVEGFRGILVDSANLYLPDGLELPGFLPESVRLLDGAIGTGGFSGAFVGDWQADWDGTVPSGDGAGTLLGIPFGLESLLLQVQQDSVTAAELTGRLALPFLDQVVSVALAVDSGGGFALTVTGTPDSTPAIGTGAEPAAPSPAVVTLTLPGLGTIRLTAVGIVRDEDGDAIVLSGDIDLVVGSPALTWPTITVTGLRIAADGTVTVPGGWIDLQEPLALDLYGFVLEISRIGFGTEADGRRWVGFDGGLRFTELLPAGVSAKGLRVIWNPADPDEPPRIGLDGVGISFGIPDVFAFEGAVALTEDPATGARMFTGELSLALEALDVGIDAAVTIGRGDGYTFVFVHLGVDLPIPIAASGAAVLGMQALFAMNMMPTARDGEWYDWFKNVPEVFQVTDPGKWSPEPGAWAFGAGLSIGTLADAGYSVNAKALLVVLLPGPVVLIEGKADIFKVPAELGSATQEGTLSLLAAVDGRVGTLQLAIDAAWTLSRLLDIGASTDAFFDFDRSDAWHLWIGRDDPESARIRAEILALFHADSWLMLDSGGVSTGLGVSFGDSWKFGPVRLTLTSWIGARAALSWRPAQFSGELSLGGEASIHVGPFGAGIAVEAGLVAQSATPYLVAGTLSVVVELPKPFRDLDVDIALEWRSDATPVVEDPWVGALLEHERCTESWLPLDGGGTTADPAADAIVVPLDARILLSFAHPMGDAITVADNPPATAPTVAIGGHTATYTLAGLRLYRWRRSHPTAGWEDVSGTVYGCWTPDAGDAGSRLQLFARTPFAFTRFTSRRWTDDFLDGHPDWPCLGAAPDPVTACVGWSDVAAGTSMPALWTQQDADLASVASHVVVVDRGRHLLTLGSGPAGEQPQPGTLWVGLPEPAAWVTAQVQVPRDESVTMRAWAGSAELDHDVRDGRSGELRVTAREGISAVTVEWGFTVESRLESICWLPLADLQALTAWERGVEGLDSAAERWDSAEPVLDPDSHYLVEVTTLAVLDRDGDEVQRVERTHAVQFQTGGPPGLVPGWVAGPAPAGPTTAGTFPHGGVLRDLARYVRWSVPDPGAVPVFRAYDLGCEFDATHVSQMYGADLRIRVCDDNARPVLDAAGAELLFDNAWAPAPTTTLTTTESAWLHRVDACTGAVRWTALCGDERLVTQLVPGLLLDDFSGLLATAWTPFVLDPAETRAANWHLEGGTLRQDVDVAGGDPAPDSPDKPGTVYVAAGVEAADVAVETVGWAGSGAYGLVFRWLGPGDYYRFSVGRQRFRLVRVRAGAVVELWSSAQGYVPDAPTRLAVQAEGPRLRCQVDERLVCDVTEADPGPPATGTVGLYTWSSATAAFDEIRARRWPGTALAPARGHTAELLATRPLFTDAFDTLDAFEQQYLDNGEPASGGSAAGGTATIATPRAGEPAVVAVAGDPQVGDYTVECTARPEGLGGFGLVARHGPAGYLSLTLTPGGGRTLLVHLRTDGGGPSSVRVLWHDPAAVTVDDDYALSMRCEGDAVTVSVDGAAHTVTAGGLTTPGRFGLHSAIAAPDGCAFSDLVVRSAPAAAVHRWAFTTSRYLGLPDLVDTFVGHTWPVDGATPDWAAFDREVAAAADASAEAQSLLDAARSALAAAVAAGDAGELPGLGEAARTAAAGLAAAAAAAYDALMAALGVPWRPVPPVVELSEVTVDGAVRVLLLDLPEPLPWERAGWTVTGPRGVPEHVVLAWSGDASRAVLVRADGSPFPAGSWELGLVLRLDVGAERAVWRRGGSTAAEVAVLRFGTGAGL